MKPRGVFFFLLAMSAGSLNAFSEKKNRVEIVSDIPAEMRYVCSLVRFYGRRLPDFVSVDSGCGPPYNHREVKVTFVFV